MSDSDGMDDLVDGGLRQSLMIGSRIAETLARRRQESQRQEEHAATQAAYEAHARLTAERSAARAALAPVTKDQWWNKAQPRDIATAYTTAEAWKNHDPAALAAAEKIRHEVLNRYGIDTRAVTTNSVSLEAGIENAATESTRQDALALSQEETRAAAAEHGKAMSLLAAASIEDLRAQAAVLAPEMERHQVPVEYLANPELAAALQTAHAAKTPAAVEATDATVKERLYLVGKDGINGPDIDQLRTEIAENVNGAGNEHFEDPGFVQAAKEMHETNLLAEAGFAGSEGTPMEDRYELAEKELFARMESVGRDLESRVTGNDSSRLQDQGLKAESASVASYGSAEHLGKFADSLENSGANEAQIRGRLVAARSEGTHPRSALSAGKGAAKARKTGGGKALAAERAKSGPAR